MTTTNGLDAQRRVYAVWAKFYDRIYQGLLARAQREDCWMRLQERWLTPASGGPAFLATLEDLGHRLAGPATVAAPDPRRHGPLAMTPPRPVARRARA